MELIKIRIQNYRSIEDVTVEVVNRCLIFLGINESGKSNILRAISALSPDFIFEFNKDSKTPVNDESYKFKEPIISYTFKISDSEKKTFLEQTFGVEPSKWTTFLSIKSSNQYVKDFPDEIIYTLTFKENNSKNVSFEYGFNEDSFKLKENFYKVNETFDVSPEHGVNFKFNEGELLPIVNSDITGQEIFKQKTTNFSPFNIFEIYKIYISTFCGLVLPSITYWKFSESHLLTNLIPIEEFKNDPNSSLPMRNIFHLAGIEDITSTIQSLYNNESAFHNLIDKLSKAATSHLKKVWKEYDGIEIIVKERNNNFSVQVKDSKNLYNFSQRSDGFKRFISFLFMLSAENKTDKLIKDSILIFDEPDNSLHPSGTRHLLKEIINLSKKNYVFVSSHSVFFIDRDKISRHIIVSKEEECTSIKQATHQNFAEEEVLYQALGASLFDVIKHRTICFEGWTDKEIFKIISELFMDDIENLKEFVKNHGVLWSSSASKICQTIRPFIGADRVFFAISDDDGSGRKEKENFEKEFTGSDNIFYTYKDFSSRDLNQMTVEDLLPVDLMIVFFNNHINDIVGFNINNIENTLFSKDKIDKSGIINSWEVFCSREYKSIKDKLNSGYKNKIPEFIKTYISDNNTELERVKNEFSFYKTYLKNKVEKIKIN